MNESSMTLTMSVAEAAEQLGVCEKSVYILTHRKDFPTIKIGRRTRISRAGLADWIRRNEQCYVEV